jgi:hypothetical protein
LENAREKLDRSNLPKVCELSPSTKPGLLYLHFWKVRRLSRSLIAERKSTKPEVLYFTSGKFEDFQVL